MDIHPPHEPVHTWKDFITHLSIMTIGLFIALMLESLVEYAHHRHIVQEARENIRRELEDNHTKMQKNLGYLQQNLDRVKGNIETLQKMLSGPVGQASLTNQMSFDDLTESAWRTARDTGALAYMPYDEVQRYSDIYSATEYVNAHAMATSEQEFTALAPALMGYDMDKLPPQELENMLHSNAQAEIDLTTEQQYIQQLDKEVEKALKK